jgi:hypothetical protein
MRPQPLSTADVLVTFGITGDLARQMTFTALYRRERRGLLGCPIVGVAIDDWTIQDLRDHARQAIEARGVPVDAEVFDRFAARLAYVRGDFADPETFKRLAAAIHGKRSPVFYLAIPPRVISLGQPRGRCHAFDRVRGRWPCHVESVQLPAAGALGSARPRAASVRRPRSDEARFVGRHDGLGALGDPEQRRLSRLQLCSLALTLDPVLGPVGVALSPVKPPTVGRGPYGAVQSITAERRASGRRRCVVTGFP